MKHIFILLFLFQIVNNNFYFSQNRSFNVIFENIDSIVSTNYPKAKQMMISLEKKYQVDPAEKLLFLNYSLENNDIRYYKTSVKDLMKNHGYSFSKYDFKIKTRNYELLELLKKHQLENWMYRQSEKLYPLWIKNHPHAFEIRKKIEELVIKDQMRGYFCKISRIDSTCGAGKILADIDYKNFIDVLHLADENGILPNHIDHGVGTYYAWQGILFHNLNTVQGNDYFLKIWSEILPYIEKTYFAGKIGYDLFQLYDQFLSRTYGYQYYGFEKGVPVKDAEHLEERKKKYGFL